MIVEDIVKKVDRLRKDVAEVESGIMSLHNPKNSDLDRWLEDVSKDTRLSVQVLFETRKSKMAELKNLLESTVVLGCPISEAVRSHG